MKRLTGYLVTPTTSLGYTAENLFNRREQAAADAQLASCEKEFEAWKQKEADWLEKWMKYPLNTFTQIVEAKVAIFEHIAELREVKHG